MKKRERPDSPMSPSNLKPYKQATLDEQLLEILAEEKKLEFDRLNSEESGNK